MKLRIASWLVFLLGSTLGAQDSDLTGKWTVESDVSGNQSRSEYSFVQKEKDLSGECVSERDAAKFTGKVDGATITWSYKIDYRGSPLTVNYKGKLETNAKMTGTLTVDEFGVSGEFTATRQ